MCNNNPTDPILGQKLTIDDIVTENENNKVFRPEVAKNVIWNDSELKQENTNEFGSRGYDKSHDGAYAD